MASKLVTVPFNDLSRSWIATSEDVKEACNRVIKSGSYVHGLEHAAFEEELANFLGASFAIGVASGTDALHLALRAVGCERGSKIITAANAGGYTSIAASEIGCEIIYSDVDALSLVITDVTLRPFLTSDTKAVVVTHLYGNIAPVDRIRALCEPLGISVIEDCAQAIGGMLNGNSVGTVGDIAAFSFYPTKNLGAAGDGGAVVTSNSTLALATRRLRQYGWDGKYSIAISGGMNSRLDEIQASILRIGLTKVRSLNSKRLEIVRQYRKELAKSDINFVTRDTNGSVAHLAVIRVPKEIGRDKVQSYLNSKGIETAIHYPILDCDQVGFPNQNADILLPESRLAQAEILSLPCFPEMTANEISLVINAILEISG